MDSLREARAWQNANASQKIHICPKNIVFKKLPLLQKYCDQVSRLSDVLEGVTNQVKSLRSQVK